MFSFFKRGKYKSDTSDNSKYTVPYYKKDNDCKKNVCCTDVPAFVSDCRLLQCSASTTSTRTAPQAKQSEGKHTHIESTFGDIENKSNQEEMCEETYHSFSDPYNIDEDSSSEYGCDQFDHSEVDTKKEEANNDEGDDEEDSGNVSISNLPVKSEHMNQLECEIKKSRELNRRLEASEAVCSRLMCRIEELQRDMAVKADSMDREDIESELLQLEEEVKDLRITNLNQEELMACLRKERDRLYQTINDLEFERKEEVQLIRQDLNEAVAEKESLQLKFDNNFEALRTVNMEREENLLSDFEWKLREVEELCKRKLDKKETSLKQEISNLQVKLHSAENEISKLNDLKKFEAETKQLRGLNLDQQRALRIAERTKEQLQVNEKVLQEEVKSLKEALNKEKNSFSTLQALHTREICEIDSKIKSTLEQQKRELNNQIEALKKQIEDDKAYYKQHIENLQSKSDSKVIELRRKLDRFNLLYEDKLEKLSKEHENEKAEMREESENKLRNIELNFQSVIRTLEFEKEHIKQDATEELLLLKENHQLQPEKLNEQLIQEQDKVKAEMDEKHHQNREQVKAEVLFSLSAQEELSEEVSKLHTELYGNTNLSSEAEYLVESIKGLNQQIASKTHQLKEIENKVSIKMRLEEDKNSETFNDLRKSLSERENYIVQLRKENHIYKLELMNHNCHSENVTAKRHKKRERGHPNKPGTSRRNHK